jgi:hypothetical protein
MQLIHDMNIHVWSSSALLRWGCDPRPPWTRRRWQGFNIAYPPLLRNCIYRQGIIKKTSSLSICYIFVTLATIL